MGAKGCYFFNGKEEGHVTGYKVEVEDTTGAGDGFMAGFLFRFVSEKIKEPENLSKEQLIEIVKFSNAVGALVSTQKGAIQAMPDLRQVKLFVSTNKSN